MKLIKTGLLVCSMIFVIIFSAGCPNKPPNVPEIITTLTVDSTYTRAIATVWVSTTDPNKDGIFYIMDWGDGTEPETLPAPLVPDEEVEPFESGDTVFVSHMYAKWSPPHSPEFKNFEIKAAAKDEKGKIQENYSTPFNIRIIYNDEPNRPNIFKKNDKGAINTLQTFKATASDTEGDSISIRFSFDKVTEWSQYRASGDTIFGYGEWSRAGIQKVWAIAKDTKGSQSVSSDTLEFETIDEGYIKGVFQATSRPDEGEVDTVEMWSTPAVVNIGGLDKIFVGSEGGYAYIVNAADMKKDADILPDVEEAYDEEPWGNTPAVDVNAAKWYIANDQGELYCLSTTGSKLWRFPDSSVTNFTGWSFFDATFTSSYVYAATEDTLFAINAGSHLNDWKWKPTGTFISTAPILDASGNILIGDDSGYVNKLDINGNLKWRKKLGDYVATSGAIDYVSGTIYFCVNGRTENLLCALNPDSGSIRWSYQSQYEITTSLAIDAQGYIYFGDDQGRIHAVNNGLPKAGYPISIEAGGVNASLSTPAFTADNFFYVMTEEQYVFCINAATGKVEWETPLPTAGLEKSKKLKREDDLIPSPAIGSDGDIYVVSGDDIGLYRILGRGTGTPMKNSPWPTFRHDNSHTGKAGAVTK